MDLGVAHPPGHPLAVLVGRAVQFQPVGSLAFRANLASAAACAGAACVLFLVAFALGGRLVRAVAERRGEDLREAPAWARAAIALAAAWTWALSGSAWLQGVRAEVYALNALLAFGVVERLLAWDDGDAAALPQAALLGGLGLCNHHLLVLLFGAAALPWALAHPRRREVARALPFVLLGLAVLAYVPVRAARGPEVNWGVATTPERLWWLLTARPFQRTVEWVAADPLPARLRDLVLALAGQIGVASAVAAVGGWWFLLRLGGTARAGALLVAAVATNLAAPALVGFDPQNPDSHGYALVALGAAAVGAACFAGGALAILGQARPAAARRARALAPALLLLGPWQAARHRAEADLSRAWGAEEFARAMLASVPTGGAIVTADFRSVFNLWYLRVAEGARPDMRHVHAGFMGFPGYATPDRAAALADPGAVVEYQDDLPDDRLRALRPGGLVLWPDGTPELHRARSRALLARLGGLPHDVQTDHALLWWRYRTARAACRLGLYDLGHEEIRAARAFSTSPLLDDLARRCGRGELEAPPPP